MRLDKDTEACDRCGQTLHTALVRFHKCLGTNMFARPANISEAEWNEALMRGLGARQVEKKRDRDLDEHVGLLDQFDALMGGFESRGRQPPPPPKVTTNPLTEYYSDVASAAEEKPERLWSSIPFLVASTLMVLGFFAFMAWMVYVGRS